MKRKEFENICFAVNTGESKAVENKSTREVGQIHVCGPDSFKVRVAGEEREWGRLICEEKDGEPQ